MNPQFIELIKNPISEKEIGKVLQVASEKIAANSNTTVYNTIFGVIDLTSLNTTDCTESITSFVNKVNNFPVNFPQVSQVAALCVFPNFVGQLKNTLKNGSIKIAAVAAGFPASQTFIEIKIAEVNLALLDGADEIDIVIPVGTFLSGDYDAVYEEISEIKLLMKEKHLKVILETGELKTPEQIFKASMLAMEAGADFIKTSTGKSTVSATPEAAAVMCKAIHKYHEKTGKKVGIKMAGGIVTVEDSVRYYSIVQSVLGADWLNPGLFRIGASRLANNLLTAIAQKEDVKYF